MAGNRALVWKENIGGNQFRLRIQDNNPDDSKQWFIFDKRTRTIRADAKRSFALANQKGRNFNVGSAAVVRTYENNSYIRASYHHGFKRNIRNNGAKCLDIHGGRNAHMHHTTFWHCHNGANQAWTLDRRGFVYPRQPLKDGHRF
jgi:hypothetical protein